MDPLVSIIVPVWNQEELVLRALRSIPRREDIEIIVVDDGSTDRTLESIQSVVSDFPDITVIRLLQNVGLGRAKNKAYDAARGLYVTELDSDDALITRAWEMVLQYLDGKTDIVYCDAVTNDGTVMHLSNTSKKMLCAGFFRFVRREFMGDTRCRNMRAGEDYYFNLDLLAKNPKEQFTNIVAYRYNFPREGSLFDRLKKGESLEP